MLGSFTLTFGGYEIFMVVCLAISLGISAIGFRNRSKAKRNRLYDFDATGYAVVAVVAAAVAFVGSVIHFEYKAGHDALPEAWKVPVERLHELPKSQRAAGLAAMVEYKHDWPELTFENVNHIISCGDNDLCKSASLDVLKPYIKIEPDLGEQLVEGPPTPVDEKIVALTESN